MITNKEEAELILDALCEEYGTRGIRDGPVPYVDGESAITEMKDDGFPGWKEVEWPGYHLKYLFQKVCQESLNGKVKPHNLGKRYLVKGDFLWDPRFNANENNQVILGGVDEYNEILKTYEGIGIFVVETLCNYDFTDEFREWHEDIKGGPSQYSKTREREGRPIRKRKTQYMIRKAKAYFFTPKDIQKGVTEGWIGDQFQKSMRNADGSSRTSKYLLKLSAIPSDYLLTIKNFNEDAEEFAEDYPEYC
ncbi:MAG: hypothetical protein CI953_1035 [Methanohalophilus sp.]|nr:MAG: hypothetical protein CI953_1035 [Methanohalophilus sp.]